MNSRWFLAGLPYETNQSTWVFDNVKNDLDDTVFAVLSSLPFEFQEGDGTCKETEAMALQYPAIVDN